MSRECLNCGERYRACQDTCTKPGVVEERRKKAIRYAERLKAFDLYCANLDSKKAQKVISAPANKARLERSGDNAI